MAEIIELFFALQKLIVLTQTWTLRMFTGGLFLFGVKA